MAVPHYCYCRVHITYFKTSHRRYSIEKLFLKTLQHSRENTCAGISFYQQETPKQVLFCEYCKIFKNNYFEEHLRTASFVISLWPTLSFRFSLLPLYLFVDLLYFSCGTLKCFISTAITMLTRTNCANNTKETKNNGAI